jgi:coenzyme F420 hydrogenase subunit beta
MSDAATAPPARWTAQWKELYAEVIDTGLCTGCAGCVIACPHDVIGYEHEESDGRMGSGGAYKPFHLEDELGFDNCVHGEKGCTSCTRACPRFRAWEPQADEHLFGKVREPDEMYGQYRQLLLVRASDEQLHKVGQDGGFVGAMLVWLLDNDYIDAALTSFLDGDHGKDERAGSGGGGGSSWKARPGVARNRDDIVASAGSRYTYSANTLALKEAVDEGLDRLALVGMSCQSSVPPIMWSRKVGKIGKPFLFNIGLLCSKTFDDAIFAELFEAKYGLRREDMVKMNIKGVFQIWMRDGSYHEIDLKECHAWTREGCKLCPDFAAEHADISTGGIGEDNDWTLCVVRTELGEEVMNRMIADGSAIAKPAEDDATAMRLLKLLSTVSRRRWPSDADPAPAVGVPPPKKKAAAAH